MQWNLSSLWSLFIICMVGFFFSSIIVFFLTINTSSQRTVIKPQVNTSVQSSDSEWVRSQTPQDLIEDTSVEFIENVGSLTPVKIPVHLVEKSAKSEDDHTASAPGIRLKIPKINIDVVLKSVGITSDGAMDMLKDPRDAAWFELGPRPGENGSAVIAGHFGWKNGILAVFDNLHTLHIGDKLYIEDEKGVTVTFIVHKLRTYGENEDTAEIFTSSDGKVHLNLITCQGVWNKAKKSYSNRLVVFTDKE